MITADPDRVAEYTMQGWWGRERIHDRFDHWVAAHPATTALVDPPNRAAVDGSSPQRLTWHEASARVTQLAGHLLRLGLRKDDVLLVQLPNTVDLPLAYLAAFRIGVIVTPVPVQYREHELEHIARLTAPRAILTTARIGRHDHRAMMQDVAGRHGITHVIMAEDGLAPDDPAALAAYEAANPVDANDVATICWTSGTEGMPKGVPRSHNEWLIIPENIVLSANLREGCHLLNPFPLVNMGGLSGLFLPWLSTGGRLVMHHPFDLQIMLRQLRDEEIDYSVVAPAILNMLAQQPEMLEGTVLRALGSGGGALSDWAVAALQTRGIPVTNYFGTNEGAALTGSMLDLPDPAKRASCFPRYGVPGFTWTLPVSRRVRTKLVDVDSGTVIDLPGQPGELRVAGPAIFSGYWNAPEQTARAFDAEGYYRTGDLFEIAGERNELYRFVGRSKDIVVRGGMNISSEEVETLIGAHPAVQEAAIIGYEDDRLGERVCAVVVTRAGQPLALDTLCGFLTGTKKVAAYKLPERLVLVEALPRNPVGKVLKRQLRERFGRAEEAAA